MNAEDRRRRAVIVTTRRVNARGDGTAVLAPAAVALAPARATAVMAAALAPAAARVAYPTIVGPPAPLAFVDDEEDYELFNLAPVIAEARAQRGPAAATTIVDGEAFVDLRKLYDVRLVLENNTELKMVLKRENKEMTAIGFIGHGVPIFFADYIEYIQTDDVSLNIEYIISVARCCQLDPEWPTLILEMRRATRNPAPRFVNLTPDKFNDRLRFFRLERRNGEIRAYKKFDNERSVIGRGSASTPNAFRLFKMRFLAKGANYYRIDIDERDAEYASKYVIAPKWTMIAPEELLP